MDLEISRGRSPGVGWTAVTRGRHRSGDPGLAGDLHAWQSVLRPTAAFTGLTSAQRRGWWLPPLPVDTPVFVAMISSQNAPRRAGMVVTRYRAIPASEVVDGVRLATVEETVAACASTLGLLDLVVVVDHVLHHRLATLAELETTARVHRRGAPRLRRALRLADGRSESAYESLLRVLHVVCGIAVEPQRELFDAAGRFVARGDLWLVGTSTIHEYDGADHLDRERQRRDLRRARRLVDARLERRGYTAPDLLSQGVAVLRDADRAVGRPHDPSRIRPWHELLRDSLFTPAGTARFRDRLRLGPAPAAEPPGREN